MAKSNTKDDKLTKADAGKKIGIESIANGSKLTKADAGKAKATTTKPGKAAKPKVSTRKK